MSEERGDSGRDPEGPSAVHLCGSVRGSSLAGAALRVAPAAAPARAALSRGGGYQRSQRAASPRWGKSLPWSGGVDIREAAEYPGERTRRCIGEGDRFAYTEARTVTHRHCNGRTYYILFYKLDDGRG